MSNSPDPNTENVLWLQAEVLRQAKELSILAGMLSREREKARGLERRRIEEILSIASIPLDGSHGAPTSATQAACLLVSHILKLLERAFDVDEYLPLKSSILRDIVLSGKLVDANWYLDQYRDVKDCGTDPSLHYAENGIREGRLPAPVFLAL